MILKEVNLKKKNIKTIQRCRANKPVVCHWIDKKQLHYAYETMI